MVERLRAAACRLGIDADRDTDVEVARLALLLPPALRTALMNEAREQGWDPVAFIGFTIRPMLGGEHDCEECASRAARPRRPR